MHILVSVFWKSFDWSNLTLGIVLHIYNKREYEMHDGVQCNWFHQGKMTMSPHATKHNKIPVSGTQGTIESHTQKECA